MKTHNFRIKAKLEQYTPMLHFQGEQKGACLRASEVKPKLDYFVLEYAKQNNIKVNDSWFARREDNIKRCALQYKLKFEAIGFGNPKEIERQSPEASLYFGFTGKDETFEIRSIFYQDGIYVTILCFIPELRDLLAKLLVPFFALHCFGTRSNKGFGSFGVEEFLEVPSGMDIPKINMLPEQLTQYLPADIPALYAGTCKNQKDMLYYIFTISAMMKGGINFREAYFRGAIITYCGEKFGAHSEKAMIKRDLLPNEKEDRAVMRRYGISPVKSSDVCIYARGTLGIAPTYTYRKNERDEIYRNGTVKVENGLIERFENPVHFKPYGKYLLLIPQTIPSSLYKQEFTFRTDRKAQTISLPDKFNLDDFLQYFIDIYNRRKEKPEMKSLLSFSKGSFKMKETFYNLNKLERISKGGE